MVSSNPTPMLKSVKCIFSRILRVFKVFDFSHSFRHLISIKSILIRKKKWSMVLREGVVPLFFSAWWSCSQPLHLVSFCLCDFLLLIGIILIFSLCRHNVFNQDKASIESSLFPTSRDHREFFISHFEGSSTPT